MANMSVPPNLRIGYVMQNGAPDLSVVSGPQLHTSAVILGLQKQGHPVRTVANQQNHLVWSDDLVQWQAVHYPFSTTPWFRVVESPIRRVQSELKLPYIGLFDSLRFADAAAHHLAGVDLLYERHGYMGYGGVLTARRLGIPIVIELNGNIVKEIDEMGVAMSSTQRRIGKNITRYTLHAADHVVVVSHALKDLLVAEFKIPAAQISVVVNGVHTEIFQRPVDGVAIRTRFGIGSGPLVTFVGSFQPWHGVGLLVDAFARVQRIFPDAQLAIVGDGAGRGDVEDQIAKLNLEAHVKLLGRMVQEQVAAVLGASDVAVAPYPFQYGDIIGTPLKLLEYMAAGKAIVASTAPIHEIIQDGVTGIRVAPADADALAAGIARLLADTELRSRLAQAAGAQAHYYSWDNIVLRLYDVFGDVVARRANGRHQTHFYADVRPKP